MADRLKRDQIMILRIEGDDLMEFINDPSYEAEMASIFSLLDSQDKSHRDCIIQALEKLTVNMGMPPISDSWVWKNVMEPALGSCENQVAYDNPVPQEAFSNEFKTVVEAVARRLKEQPVIVAHIENTFDGSGIKRLLSNKLELEKALNSAVEGLARDRQGKASKKYLRVALDAIAPSGGFPPFGAFDEMDKVVGEVFKMIDVDDGKLVKDDEFKKLLTEILGSMMLQLQGSPISITSNSVVHEPVASPPAIFLPTSTSQGSNNK